MRGWGCRPVLPWYPPGTSLVLPWHFPGTTLVLADVLANVLAANGNGNSLALNRRGAKVALVAVLTASSAAVGSAAAGSAASSAVGGVLAAGSAAAGTAEISTRVGTRVLLGWVPEYY